MQNEIEQEKINLAFQKHLQLYITSIIAIISFLASLSIALTIAFLTEKIAFSINTILALLVIIAMFLVPLLFWRNASKRKMDAAFYRGRTKI